MFFSVEPSLAEMEMRQNLFMTGGFQYALQDHRRLPVFIYRPKIGIAEFCEEGYLHDFQD
jgi:hypothetical protein